MSTFTGAIEKWFEFCTIKHYKMAKRCVFLMALVKVLTREALEGAHAWTLVALAQSLSVWSDRFGETRLVSAPKLTNVYPTPSMST